MVSGEISRFGSLLTLETEKVKVTSVVVLVPVLVLSSCCSRDDAKEFMDK